MMDRIADYVLVRVAGLSFDALEELRCFQTLESVCEIETLEAKLEGQRQQLCERLFQVITGTSDTKLRRALLDLKRSVFNCRSVTLNDSFNVVSAILTNADPELLRELKAWEEIVLLYHRLVLASEASVRADIVEVRKKLAALWLRPELQTGILLAQPELFQQLCKYFAKTDSTSKQLEKLERTALAYCYRMGTKTSPFSAFTATGIGRFASVDAAAKNDAWLQARSFFRLRAAVIDDMGSALRSHPELRLLLPLYLNDTLQVEVDQARYFVSRPRENYGVRVIADDEFFVSVKLNEVATQILKLVASHPGAFSISSLMTTISEWMLPDLSLARLGSMITKLVNCGLLRPLLQYDANHPIALTQLGEAVSVLSGDLSTTVSLGIAQIQSLIEALSDQPPNSQFQTLSSLSQHVEELLATVRGSSKNVGPQIIVHQDYLLNEVVQVSEDAIQPFLPALDRINAVMPLFNVELPYLHHVQNFYREQYEQHSRYDNIITVYQNFIETRSGTGNGASNFSNATPDTTVCNITGTGFTLCRDSLIDLLRRHATESACHAVKVPNDLFEKYAELAQAFLPPLAPLSTGFLGQFSPNSSGDSYLQFVINKVVPGYGTLAAQFAAERGEQSPGHWLVSELRRELQALVPDAEVVDLVGTFRFDGQIHPKLTRRRLVYPGESIQSGIDSPIPWSEIGVAFDANRGVARLMDCSTGQWLLPVHTGTLSPGLLPPFFRFLMTFGVAFIPDLPLIDFFEGGPTTRDSQKIRHYSRLEHEGVVLSRETWCVSLDEVFPSDRSESDVALFRRLRRWARDLGLPPRVYVTPVRNRQFHQDNYASGSFRRLHKPFYVDWDDLLSHHLFRRYTTGVRGPITITEMLPLPEQLPFRQDGQHFVTEHLIELYQSLRV